MKMWRFGGSKGICRGQGVTCTCSLVTDRSATGLVHVRASGSVGDAGDAAVRWASAF
jgi:hypothetical protein